MTLVELVARVKGPIERRNLLGKKKITYCVDTRLYLGRSLKPTFNLGVKKHHFGYKEAPGIAHFNDELERSLRKRLGRSVDKISIELQN